jgi:hypothetical protein
MNNWEFADEDKNSICTKDSAGNRFLFANGFIRIVHGGRGDYVEFSEEQLVSKRQFSVPFLEEWRATSGIAYYIEYRYHGVKVYFQKRTVNYADYKVGYYYVSPVDLHGFRIAGRR